MKWTTYVLITAICVYSVHQTTAISKQLTGKYRDCWGRWKAGEKKPGNYVVYPNGTHPVKLFCNHTDSGTSAVIQRRVNGQVSFKRGIVEYQTGFGIASGDYWAGLETISHLTSIGNNHLVIHMTDWDGKQRFAQYSYFHVMDRTQYYRLYISGFSGNVGDDMSHSNGMYFYTYDAPDHHGCATNMHAGWWYNYCAFTLPNGAYYPGPYQPKGTYYDGIYWKDWMGYGYSLKFISMTIY